MDLDLLWERIFSEDEQKVRLAWDSLSDDERKTVQDLLDQICADPQRIAEQRSAARFALRVMRGEPAESALGPVTALAVAPSNDLPAGVLDFARELAHQTGERLKFASGQLIASTKKDGTLVTASDIEADQHLGDSINARYPDHGVLSEEGDKVYRGQEWCWVIDPIDGTTNFTWGFPAWGVLVALLHHGQPVLGVAEFPPIGQQFYAAHGQGAWRKTEIGYGDGPIHTAIDKTLTSTQLFVLGTRSLKYGKPDIPCKLRLPGSSGFDFAMLAGGACIGAYDSLVHVWDVAALWPIIEEAGGRAVTNHPGGIFPLISGVDYSSVTFAALGAGSAEILTELLARFSDRFHLP
ncbi:MAG TPA: inositol monophosphatase family protein [Anaerolineae bacterium]